MNKLLKFIRNAIVPLFFGLKYTEEDILKQKASPLSSNNSLEQKIQQNQLAEALLKGEVTEEVEMLRDRTYFVAEESKKFSVVVDLIGTSKAFKRNSRVNQPKVHNPNDLNIKLIVDNYAIPSGVLDALNSIGSYGIKDIYPLEFAYDYIPKFKLNQYANKLVLRTDTSNNSVYLDLYVPIYTESFERMHRIFDTEIKKVIKKEKKSTNLEFDTVEFVTNKSYGVEDLCKFKFKMIKLLTISVFEQKYVLTYQVKTIENGNKITDKYINKKIRENYKNNTSRNTTLNLNTNKKEPCHCEKCGCEIDNIYDYRITKTTVGIGLCNKCLEAHNKKINV